MRKSIFYIGIALIQILILINMPTANSYQISQADKIFSEKIIKKDFGEKILESGINLMIGFFSIKQIGFVSAQEIEFNCCLETEQGELCKDFLTGQENNCKTELIASECNKISSCELGCCIDKEEGFCSPNSINQDCEINNGEWKNEESCALAECQKACCVLGDEFQFVEEARCEKLSSLFGFEKDFRQQIKNEIECLSLGAEAIDGACIYAGERCEHQSESECISRGGNFNSRMLCSNTELKTGCDKQASVGCVDGKDEIYWFDSCGNSENIYSSDKNASWNNGYFLSKSESCNSDSPNINSEDCGNCEYLLGSKCSETKTGETKIQDGDFVCRDMKCVDETGRVRENGESWCVYDGVIGNGKDVVGSRHWKRMCIDGEIKIEPCADYRGQICVQSETEISNETGKKFSVGNCVINEASVCINYNSEKENMTKLCQENNMCYLKTINVDDGFKFDLCLPQYPKGNDLDYENGAENNLCSMANQKCSVVYEKKFDSDGDFIGWECVFNCDCEEKIFSSEMNDFCTSLGDCGSYVNILGQGTDSIQVSGAPSVSWKEYSQYAQMIVGQFAEPKKLSEVLISHSSTSPEAYNSADNIENEIIEAVSIGGGIAGGLGTIIAAVYVVPGIYGTISGVMSEAGLVAGIKTGYAAGMAKLSAASIGPAFSALGAFIVGVAVSSILTMAFGLEGQSAMIMTVAGVGAGIALASISWAGGATACFGPQAVICSVIVAILIVIAIVLKTLGIGKTKEVIVSFECLPWEAPDGGSDCAKCNDEPLKPCSEYRCESLGQACKLLNEDTENPSCEKIVDDFKPPIISAGNIDYGYNFENEDTWSVKIKKSDTECIPEFSPIKFELNTDEPAQCKYDFQKREYEEMENYPLDLNAYVSNHSFGLMIPSLSSLEIYNLSGDIKKQFGNMNMYVKCKDYYGDINTKEYIVNFCVESGPDLTPAYITKFSPEDGGFLKYQQTEIPLTIFLNEPAECKFDINENKSYEEMSKTMNCLTEIEKAEIYGWKCESNLTELNKEENKIYIKCKDQPWFKNTENESQRNINTDGFIYAIYSTQSPLKINSLTPQGEIEAGFEPVSVDFEIKTSGGAYDGDSACYYNFDGSEKFILFKDTYSNLHNQNINQLMNGIYLMNAKCEDEAGNVAESSTEINIKIDKEPPEIIRAYEEYGQLVVQTDEKAECYYSPEKCIYDIENSTLMTAGYSTEHKSDWKAGTTYHIKCIDVWENRPDECSIKLMPDFFISLILNKFINKFIV